MVCCADTTIEAEMAQTHLDIDTALKAEVVSEEFCKSR
jgi:hypothetical protein